MIRANEQDHSKSDSTVLVTIDFENSHQNSAPRLMTAARKRTVDRLSYPVVGRAVRRVRGVESEGRTPVFARLLSGKDASPDTQPPLATPRYWTLVHLTAKEGRAIIA